MMSFNTAKTVPNELAQKPQISILDRFRALLKERDVELRVLTEDDVSPPTANEMVQLYEILLSELTFNCKPIITDLTIIAGEQREHAKGIADAICARIVKVPVEQKLPSLYLLDSIVKNIGHEYIKYFSTHLPEVFCEAYKQVHPDIYPAMRHLFRTWSACFPLSVLHKIETQLQFSPSANQRSSGFPPLKSPGSPQPSHGIHVNPKYLRQLQQSTIDTNAQHAKGSSTLNVFAQKPSIGTIGRDEEASEWRRKHFQDGNQKRFEASVAYNHSNGVDRSGARALIDAYGNDHRETTSNNMPLLDERLDTNGLSNKANMMSWQNTEEEEFDWEDMSPALLDRGRSNDPLSSSIPSFRSFNSSPGLRAPSITQLEHDMMNDRSSQAQPSAIDDTFVIANGSIPSFGFDHGSASKILHFKNEVNANVNSVYPQDPRNISHPLGRPSEYHPNLKGRGRGFQMSSSDISSVGEKVPPFIDKLPDYNPPLFQPLSVMSRMGSSTIDSIRADAQSVIPASTGLRPPLNMHGSCPPPMLPNLTMHNRLQRDYNSGYGVKNLGANESLNTPEQHFPYQSAGLISVYQPNRLQNSMQTQYHPNWGAREHIFPSSAARRPSHMVNPNLDHGYASQVHGSAPSDVLSNPVPLAQPTLPTNNFLNRSLHSKGGSLPPLSRGPLPLLPSNSAGTASSGQQPSNSFSGLINSLMTQGLISLTKPAPAQDSVGIEFSSDLLKMRHEFAINSLYSDLPRQCTTCGLRFKFQEEHSNHMDWHVTKNRMSKSRKQKASRKWFVNASMWLSGAEALGTDAVPGFLPTEPIVENKANEEMAVPADEDQNACALCGEPFEDFYSDEIEEWMYKGAVYLNAQDGSTAGMDRSHLGPIVHAKCRSQSSLVPPEGYVRNEGGLSDESSQRKRLRS